jgi:hypothetical protein
MRNRLISGLAVWALIMGCCLVFAERRAPAAQLPAAPAVGATADAPSSSPQFQDRTVEQEMLALGHHARVDMLLTAPDRQSAIVLGVVVLEPKAGTH